MLDKFYSSIFFWELFFFFFSLFALDNISQVNLVTVYKSDNYLL
jgi:hypothetical protein